MHFKIILFLIFFNSIVASDSEIKLAINQSDCEFLNLLVMKNYKITVQNKEIYMQLSQEQIKKAFKSKMFLPQLWRIIKTAILFSVAKMGIYVVKEKIQNKDYDPVYNCSLSIINFSIIYCGLTQLCKFIRKFDLKNRRNRALAVETLIEKLEVV